MGTIYNRSKIYDESIEPLVHEIKVICNENHIPFFAAFGVILNDNEKFDDENGIKAEILLPELFDSKNKDQRFSGYINLTRNAKLMTVYPGNNNEVVTDMPEDVL